MERVRRPIGSVLLAATLVACQVLVGIDTDRDSIEIARKAAGAGCDVRGTSPGGGHGFSRWAIRIRIQPVVDDRVPL